MLRDSVVVVVVVFVRTRPRAMPLAMITMTKSTHGFPFFFLYGYGAPLGGSSGRRSSAFNLMHGYLKIINIVNSLVFTLNANRADYSVGTREEFT